MGQGTVILTARGMAQGRVMAGVTAVLVVLIPLPTELARGRAQVNVVVLSSVWGTTTLTVLALGQLAQTRPD